MSDTTSASSAARRGVLVFEQPFATMVLTGPDRRDWLNGLVTCDVKPVEPGHGAWGLLLSKQGKIKGDVNVVAGTDALLVGVPEPVAGSLFDSLKEFLIMEDAELGAPTTDYRWLTLHGPQAAELAKAIVPDGGGWGAIDWTGLGGAAVVAPAEEASAVVAKARTFTGFEVAIGTQPDWERLRVERTLPVYGTDYDERDNPHDASLERRAVSWTKGCYLGQEVVCMQDMRGKLRRRVIALALDSKELPRAGTLVEGGGGNAGEVTSSAFSEILGKPVVLARVSARALESGEPLLVDGRVAERLEPAP